MGALTFSEAMRHASLPSAGALLIGSLLLSACDATTALEPPVEEGVPVVALPPSAGVPPANVVSYDPTTSEVVVSGENMEADGFVAVWSAFMIVSHETGDWLMLPTPPPGLDKVVGLAEVGAGTLEEVRIPIPTTLASGTTLYVMLHRDTEEADVFAHDALTGAPSYRTINGQVVYEPIPDPPVARERTYQTHDGGDATMVMPVWYTLTLP